MELVMWKVLSKLLCFFVVNGSDKHWHWYGKAINRSFCGLLTQKVYFIINTYRITCLCSRYWAVVLLHAERERNVLFNDALNTFYLRLYGVRHMVKDHSDSEKGNPLPPHRLLLAINSKGYFICTIPQTG